MLVSSTDGYAVLRNRQSGVFFCTAMAKKAYDRLREEDDARQAECLVFLTQPKKGTPDLALNAARSAVENLRRCATTAQVEEILDALRLEERGKGKRGKKKPVKSGRRVRVA